MDGGKASVVVGAFGFAQGWLRAVVGKGLARAGGAC